MTGAARRLGKSIAVELARRGTSVFVHFRRSEEEAKRTVREIRALGTDAWAVGADLSSPADIERIFDFVRVTGHGLDALVNSAASFERQGLLDIAAAAWDDVMAINLRAPFLCTQAAARMMSDSTDGGAIVNIADLSGIRAWKEFAHHSTSKAGLIHLTKASARELAPTVRVNCIVPGAILPPPGIEESDSSWQRLGNKIPLRRTGSGEELAKAVCFLLQHDFITGAVLPVDGGEHLGAR